MRALISVSDKTGIVEFAEALQALGVEVISTGGTATLLRDNGIHAVDVSQITEFPECLDGRVKTLHPKIHGGILAIRDNEDHKKTLETLEITPIELVVVNLYPFKQTIMKEGCTLDEAIENIDIGGPAMLRSAAKNHKDVVVITDPDDYSMVLEQWRNHGKVDDATRFRLARKVFAHTAAYDAMIVDYLDQQANDVSYGASKTLTFEKVQDLRYGENPHQEAAFYKEIGHTKGTLVEALQLHGKELSFNNINDTNSALEILKEFYSEPTVVAVKHANPCGVGSGETIFDAFIKAYEGDPLAIFGGIVAMNQDVDQKTAEKISGLFIEVVVAPSYSPEALMILQEKKSIRLLQLADLTKPYTGYEVKKVMGGLLIQDTDDALLGEHLEVVTKRSPSAKEMEDLMFAWKVVKHTKSNAISIAKNKMLVANGPGQVSRIASLQNAIRQGADKVEGSVMASDAYLPFSDSVEAAYLAGITAIVQPGGSVRDEDSIALCDRFGMAMVFTGMRHFKH
jgi:phosphoribosylaminoimidazolecarboxamide formyltransferase/IMP cyclohydrolase